MKRFLFLLWTTILPICVFNAQDFRNHPDAKRKEAYHLFVNNFEINGKSTINITQPEGIYIVVIETEKHLSTHKFVID